MKFTINSVLLTVTVLINLLGGVFLSVTTKAQGLAQIEVPRSSGASILPGDSPEVSVYEPKTGALYHVTADGRRDSIDMSPVVTFAGQNSHHYLLSPDRTKLFFIREVVDAKGHWTSGYYMADLLSRTCCQKLDSQDPSMTDVLAYYPAFSPDGTQMAVSFFHSEYSDTISGQLVIFDLATLNVVARLDANRLEKPFRPGFTPAVLFAWPESGLLVWSSCAACEPVMKGIAQLWNPSTDKLISAKVPFNFQGLRLGTGERLNATFDPNFPNNPKAIPESPTMQPVPNVVTYTPQAWNPAVAVPVIYFNPKNIYIYQVQWVGGGQAVLIQHADQVRWAMPSKESYILQRNGMKIPVSLPITRQFLAATSNGWMMIDTATHGYIYYRLTGTTVEEIMLDTTYTSSPVVIGFPKFGPFVQPGPSFPAITQP